MDASPNTHLADTRLSHPKALAFVKLQGVTPLSDPKAFSFVYSLLNSGYFFVC
jgi:hypothetical protein